jgi:hypothetical protein
LQQFTTLERLLRALSMYEECVADMTQVEVTLIRRADEHFGAEFGISQPRINQLRNEYLYDWEQFTTDAVDVRL